MAVEKFTLFWDGPFSQWHSSPMVIDGVAYSCAEQFMMAEKARLFCDKASETAIMKAEHPAEQKSLGRMVKNFNRDLWMQNAKLIVYRGNYTKFSDDNFFSLLMTTRGTTLVEASPYDAIWGIGLGADKPEALDRLKWRGTNWLGEILTKVREDLIARRI